MTKTLLLSAAFACGMMAQAQTVVTIPEDVETTTWEATLQSLDGDNVNWTDMAYTVEVGIDGDELYIQGLCPRFPDAWVVGAIEGNDLIITAGQKLGVFKSSNGGTYDIYFSGYDGSSTNITEAVWQYDAKANAIYGDYFVSTADLRSLYALDVMQTIVLQGPELNGLHTVKAEKTTETYDLSGKRLGNLWNATGIKIENGRKVIK